MATFTNQATLSYNNTVLNSNVATGEIVEVLSTTKTAVTPEYRPGEDVTFVVSVVNSGAAPVNGLTLNDNLGEITTAAGTSYPLTYKDGSLKYYVNGVLQPAPTVTSTEPLTVSNITIPANSNALFVYEANTNAFAPLEAGSTITNTATVNGAGLTAPVTAQETIAVAEEPSLAITKSISPSIVTENSRVTYTFTIQNFGNTPVTADGDAVVTDTFNPILNDIDVAFNGTPWAETTNYTYDEITGLFRTVENNITVPAATFTQNPDGTVTTTPGTSVLTVTGTI